MKMRKSTWLLLVLALAAILLVAGCEPTTPTPTPDVYKRQLYPLSCIKRDGEITLNAACGFQASYTTKYQG